MQPLSIDIPASSSPPTPPYQTHHRRAILFPFLSINSSVPLFRPFSPPFFSYSPNAFLCFALKFSQDFLSSPHSPSTLLAFVPAAALSDPVSLSVLLLLLLERPRESLSSFRTLLPTVPLPHSHRPRRYRFLSSSSALLLSHPSQASRVCRPRRRARCTSSSSSVEPSFRVCQLMFPLARRESRKGGEEREEREETAGRCYGARYARDTGGEWRKREADKGSVLLQSEASEIFYELNCAGGLSAACRNRCPKISRPTVVTDYLDICPSIFRYFPHNFLPSSWIFLRNRIPRAFTFTFTFFPFYFACIEGNFVPRECQI